MCSNEVEPELGAIRRHLNPRIQGGGGKFAPEPTSLANRIAVRLEPNDKCQIRTDMITRRSANVNNVRRERQAANLG